MTTLTPERKYLEIFHLLIVFFHSLLPLKTHLGVSPVRASLSDYPWTANFMAQFFCPEVQQENFLAKEKHSFDLSEELCLPGYGVKVRGHDL